MTDTSEELARWIAKIDILKDQINKLAELTDFPIIAISVFLLKSQIVEFEIKQFISTLDLHLSINNNSKLIKKRIRTPKSLDSLTLRKLTQEVKQFRGSDLDKLNSKFKELVDKRDHFTHHLFSIKSDVKALIRDAKRGVKIANEVLEIMSELETEYRK